MYISLVCLCIHGCLPGHQGGAAGIFRRTNRILKCLELESRPKSLNMAVELAVSPKV